MDRVIESYRGRAIAFGELELCLEQGIAWQRDRSRSVPYDSAYWQKYQGYAGSEIERKLLEVRVELARWYCGAPVCEADQVIDVGIGSGAFLAALWDAAGVWGWGYDVTPEAAEWLKTKRRWCDPYAAWPERASVMTLWDVLEHLPEPGDLLSRVPEGAIAIVSLPIFTDLLRVRESKHYRPDEHFFYFTAAGLLKYFDAHGFACVEISDGETRAGRESIGTFVFQRR